MRGRGGRALQGAFTVAVLVAGCLVAWHKQDPSCTSEHFPIWVAPAYLDGDETYTSHDADILRCFVQAEQTGNAQLLKKVSRAPADLTYGPGARSGVVRAGVEQDPVYGALDVEINFRDGDQATFVIDSEGNPGTALLISRVQHGPCGPYLRVSARCP